MIYKETKTLENAYKKFGNVQYVDEWFGAECWKDEDGFMRPVDYSGNVKKINSIRKKPMWYRAILQLDFRPAERLNMNERLDTALIQKGKRWPNIYPETAIELERIARKSPKNDWRVELISAFESLIYQRQGIKKWVLIEIGKGYA